MEQKKADNIQFCEVVQDLLPLYVDGALKRGSVDLVELHLKTCADCRARLKRMQTSLTGELPQTELPPEAHQPEPKCTAALTKKAFKKVRNRMRLIVCLCLAVLLAIPLGIFTYREVNGVGLCFGSYRAWKATKKLVATWNTDGADAFAAGLDASIFYQDRSQPLTDAEVYDRTVYNLCADSSFLLHSEEAQSVSLLGEQFVMSSAIYQEFFADQSGEGPEGAIAACLANDDEMGAMWNFMLYLQNNNFIYILPENIYQQILEHQAELERTTENLYQDNKLDTDQFYKAELYGNACRIYVGEETFDLSESNGNLLDLDEVKKCIAAAAQEYYDYPEDMAQQVPDAAPISDDFRLAAALTSFLPEEIWNQMLEEYQEIRQNYTAYTESYAQMSEETFCIQWQQELAEQFRALGLAEFDAAGVKYDLIRLKDYWQISLTQWMGENFNSISFGVDSSGKHMIPLRVFRYENSEQSARLNRMLELLHNNPFAAQ